MNQRVQEMNGNFNINIPEVPDDPDSDEELELGEESSDDDDDDDDENDYQRHVDIDWQDRRNESENDDDDNEGGLEITVTIQRIRMIQMSTALFIRVVLGQRKKRRILATIVNSIQMTVMEKGTTAITRRIQIQKMRMKAVTRDLMRGGGEDNGNQEDSDDADENRIAPVTNNEPDLEENDDETEMKNLLVEYTTKKIRMTQPIMVIITPVTVMSLLAVPALGFVYLVMAIAIQMTQLMSTPTLAFEIQMMNFSWNFFLFLTILVIVLNK
ncbi:hypothetical protein GCK72_004170 [Caenorhabditis remanei]|uniref:Uncharacterized protein n=1 Tax=Caenorhabditis remanei TaxID=31234 RepID=A0A6A5HCX5_CAERE|nr:hypothetical protein GCK72_004170 [Caenorhabditis remanei]KAF1764223.1 hypothetical protein GCK72_004170 [Caenorhabditis remanei]